jgi:predicted  nucleic acid-binding Zn-ribbon protein
MWHTIRNRLYGRSTKMIGKICSKCGWQLSDPDNGCIDCGWEEFNWGSLIESANKLIQLKTGVKK